MPFKPSPNIGKNKAGVPLNLTPQYLIQHFDAAANATGAISWMLSPKSKVSAHLHIDREGNITQLVAFNRIAHHAGESEWRGLFGMNSRSIGIEIQNTGSQDYTAKQMDAVAEVSKLLVSYYNLKEVIGHEDVAPIRKNDPSGTKVNLFDWAGLLIVCGLAPSTKATTADLNIRRGQGTQFPVVTKIPKGDAVFELNRIGTWSKIQVVGSNQSGWVSNAYLTKAI
ncbi:N-acetylmuramoyl-L-alanine amidase [Pedobacter agri]|uniref:N-acetylmuramoyl-L-alanine amidase n=1 Tax=Pedobacter agri TaxID=454586 RepID=UPI0027D7D68E|nr:N-acetylmuramoyl-L-alanine amidase [Pedobacter agri]